MTLSEGYKIDVNKIFFNKQHCSIATWSYVTVGSRNRSACMIYMKYLCLVQNESISKHSSGAVSYH